MLNLLPDYEEGIASPSYASPVFEPDTVLLYLHNNIIPNNLFEISTQTKSFRDAVLARMAKADDVSQIANTLVRKLKTTKQVLTNEDISLCEYAATAAYLCGDYKLVKEILLRVPPQLATRYINILYTSISIRLFDVHTFKTAVEATTNSADLAWESERATLSI